MLPPAGSPDLAIVFVQDVDGGNQAFYDQVVDAVRFRDDPPAGLICHTAGPTADGWRIVDVWESADDLYRYRNERVLPVVDRLGGFPSPPRVQVTEVYDLFVPD